jgi:uncharacterized protein YodC (DUF2158 family)
MARDIIQLFLGTVGIAWFAYTIRRLLTRRKDAPPMPEFNWTTGDVVALKSGGRAMTVSHSEEDETVVCTHWHDDSGVPQSARYHRDMLEEADTDE